MGTLFTETGHREGTDWAGPTSFRRKIAPARVTIIVVFEEMTIALGGEKEVVSQFKK